MFATHSWILQAALVGIGGFFGSVARFGVGELTRKLLGATAYAVFPFGTLAVNITGSFLLTFFIVAASGRQSLGTLAAHLLIAIGFCGAYTTFRTLAYETDQLITTGHPWLATANMLGTVSAGLLAVRLAYLLR